MGKEAREALEALVDVLQTDKDLRAAELQSEAIQRGMTQLRQQHVQLPQDGRAL